MMEGKKKNKGRNEKMMKKNIATEVCSGCFDSRLGFREGLETWVIGKWLEVEPLGIRACLNCGFVQCSKCHINMETQIGEKGQFFYCPGCNLRITIEMSDISQEIKDAIDETEQELEK